MNTRFVAPAAALALLAFAPTASEAQSLKDLIKAKLQGKSDLAKDAEEKLKAKKDAPDTKAKPGSMEDMMKAKIEEKRAKDAASQPKTLVDKLIDTAHEVVDKGHKKFLFEKGKQLGEKLKDQLLKKEEKEETLLDKWKEKKAKEGPGVEELMKAKMGAKPEAAPEKKEKTLEELLKEKLGKK